MKLNEIEKALNAGCYQSALALALTIPDICGKVAYDSSAVGERYIKWFNKYVGCLDNIKEFDGNACYLLRCSYLHSGKIRVKNKSIKRFKLHVDVIMGEPNVHSSVICVGNKVELDIDIWDLCDSICRAALKFYNECNNDSLFVDDLIEDMSWSDETCFQLFNQSEVDVL